MAQKEENCHSTKVSLILAAIMLKSPSLKSSFLVKKRGGAEREFVNGTEGDQRKREESLVS